MNQLSDNERRFLRHRWSFFCFLFLANGLLTTLLLVVYFPNGSLSSVKSLGHLVAYGYLQTAPLFVLYAFLLLLPILRPRWWMWFGETLRTAFLLCNAVIFLKVEFHLTSQYVLNGLRTPGFWNDVGINAWVVLVILGVIASLFALQWWFWWLWLRWLRWRQSWGRVGLRALRNAVIVSGFAGAILAGLWSIPKPLAKTMNRQLPFFTRLAPFQDHAAKARRVRKHLQSRLKALRYPRVPLKRINKKKVQRPHIIMFVAESLRGDMFNAKDMPHTYRLAQRIPGIRSRYHFSGGHQTWEGTFSQLYSLWGYHRDLFRNQPIPPYPLHILKKLGYTNMAFTASTLRFQGYKASLRHFDKYEDVRYMNSIRGDKWITDRAINAIKSQRGLPQAKQRPLFLFVFYQSTHFPFLFPPKHAVFKPYESARGYQITNIPEYRKRLWNKYRNSTRYVDAEIHRLLQALRPELKAGKLAFSVTGDHGEEFWDHGWFGHAARRMTNARMLTPFFFHYPSLRKKRIVPLSSHVDIFPTLFDLMGLKYPTRHYSDGRSLIGKARAFVHLNGYNFPRYPLFTIATPKYKIYARRTHKFQFELNRITTIDDRPIKKSVDQVRPVIRRWMSQLNTLYPGHHLFRSSKILVNRMPHYPQLVNRGPIRTPRRPALRPWDRLGGVGDRVTKKRPKVQFPLKLHFGKGVTLIGYNLKRRNIRAGELFHIEYIWHCHARLPPTRRLFYHLKRSQAPTFVNVGEVPVLGLYPLYRWKPGEYIRDKQVIFTKIQWLPGETRLWVGMYDSKTKRRIPIKAGTRTLSSALITSVNITQ